MDRVIDILWRLVAAVILLLGLCVMLVAFPVLYLGALLHLPGFEIRYR